MSIRQLKAIHSACHPSSKVKRPEKPEESIRTVKTRQADRRDLGVAVGSVTEIADPTWPA